MGWSLESTIELLSMACTRNNCAVRPWGLVATSVVAGGRLGSFAAAAARTVGLLIPALSATSVLIGNLLISSPKTGGIPPPQDTSSMRSRCAFAMHFVFSRGLRAPEILRDLAVATADTVVPYMRVRRLSFPPPESHGLHVESCCRALGRQGLVVP